MTYIASIDIGSHTARLLVSKKPEPPGILKPIIRKRAYIRLGEGFKDLEHFSIKNEAIDRTLNALEDFVSITRKFQVRDDEVHAVSTGVVREAVNGEQLLRLIHDRTGIKVRLLTAEEEARLTGRGVLFSLDIREKPFLIFDLGGGSTEFIYERNQVKEVKSIPLGALILTERFLKGDPPHEQGIKILTDYVDGILKDIFPEKLEKRSKHRLIGTGGTVTTLGAMIYGIGTEEISPERMNGLTLKREGLEDLFLRIKGMMLEERLKLRGLDRGRADVIPAGALIVLRILYFFKSMEMTVSLSDLLEGILMEYLQGETDRVCTNRSS